MAKIKEKVKFRKILRSHIFQIKDQEKILIKFNMEFKLLNFLVLEMLIKDKH